MGGRRRVHLRFPCGGEGEAGFSGVAEAGDFIMIHPFEIHACEDIGGSSLDWKSLRLSRESVLPILGRTEGSFPPILRDRKLRRLFELLCAAVKEGGNRERQRELLAAVLRGLPRKTNRCAGKRRNIPSPFPDILRWLAERSEWPSLDAAARRFGVDKFVLLRGFSANFGITPYRCLGVHAPGARSRHVAARACASGRGSGAGFCGSKPSDAGFSQGIRHAAGGIPALETGAGHTGRIKVELKPVLNAGGASEPAVDAKTVLKARLIQQSEVVHLPLFQRNIRCREGGLTSGAVKGPLRQRLTTFRLAHGFAVLDSASRDIWALIISALDARRPHTARQRAWPPRGRRLVGPPSMPHGNAAGERSSKLAAARASGG